MPSAASKPDPSKFFPWMQSAAKQQSAGSDELPKPKIVAEPVPRTALGTEETALSLGVSVATLREWSKKGIGPPCFQMANRGHWMYPIQTTKKWLRDQVGQAPDEADDRARRN